MHSSQSRVRSTAGAEICSCNLCIHAIHGVHAGGTTPWTGEVERVGNTRSRAMQEQLPSAYLYEFYFAQNGTRSVSYPLGFFVAGDPISAIALPQYKGGIMIFLALIYSTQGT
jgi:hypothetical protein